MEPQNSSTPPQSNDYIFQFAVPASFSHDGNRTCFAARTLGLFRSSDGGQTWESAYTSLNTREALPTTAIALAPDFNHEPTVFAGLNGAILRSYDGGTNWQRSRLPTPSPAISALAIAPNYVEAGIVFAGTNEDGVLVSNDRGKNWVSWNFGLLDLNILCLAISPDFATDETLFAGTESGLFSSTNGGRAWKEVALPIGFDAILSLAISLRFAQDNTLFVGTENNGLLISRDRGKSWQPLTETISAAPVNQILLSPAAPTREIFILHGGEPLVSIDSGKSWKAWKSKLLGGRDVTALLAANSPWGIILVGCEDGRVLSVYDV
jgi:photosystem II stability/assembly factor-like uncharacterized protein